MKQQVLYFFLWSKFDRKFFEIIRDDLCFKIFCLSKTFPLKINFSDQSCFPARIGLNWCCRGFIQYLRFEMFLQLPRRIFFNLENFNKRLFSTDFASAGRIRYHSGCKIVQITLGHGVKLHLASHTATETLNTDVVCLGYVYFYV